MNFYLSERPSEQLSTNISIKFKIQMFCEMKQQNNYII